MEVRVGNEVRIREAITDPNSYDLDACTAAHMRNDNRAYCTIVEGDTTVEKEVQVDLRLLLVL